MIKVGFQGIKGAYSEKAAQEYHAKQSIETVPFESFEKVFKAVESGQIKYGMIPIENSVAGSIYENYDNLLAHKVWIGGEHILRVNHSLLAIEGASLRKIDTVYSHPQALGQCQKFLSRKQVKIVPYFDTAGAARFVAEKQSDSIAAIAGSHAGEEYGLNVLKSSIEDSKKNVTRIFVIEKMKKLKKSTDGPLKSTHKTSVVFALKNTPGCLHKCLSVFAIRDIDLSKIQSRPVKSSPWRYHFHLDIVGDYFNMPVFNAIKHLQEITTMVKVLGTYRHQSF